MARILIIEDDKLLIKVYQNALETEKHEVATSLNGKDGLVKILEGGFDLILLDIRLPQKDGLEILDDLRRVKPSKKNGPILVLSNINEKPIMKKALKLGAVGYLLKDRLEPDSFMAEIRNYLKQSKLY